jgi:type III secretion protein N (ATPase)
MQATDTDAASAGVLIDSYKSAGDDLPEPPPAEDQTGLVHLLEHSGKSVKEIGRIVKAYGTTVHVSGITAGVGQRCEITDRENGRTTHGDVVGLNDKYVTLYLLGSLEGISSRSEVRVVENGKNVPFSESLKGCILDGTGRLIYQPHELTNTASVPIDRPAPDPLTRHVISSVFSTGVKVLDTMTTVGEGQRMGIFAAAGVGKSTLLSMLAKHSDADAIVIGLIGERGREVREFIEHNLGAEGLAKSVMVVSTSDRPALERVSAAKIATTIAEGFRAHGQRVLLLLDSVTRYARAMREIGLSVGEPPTRRGYPPSVFAELPKLLERTGNDDVGSITAFYTVLEEDEDTSDPIAEEVKSILDGHIVLSRAVAESGQYPPVDVLPSTSRVFRSIADENHINAAQSLRTLLAKYKENELLLSMGEYQEGSDPIMDQAIRNKPLIDNLLRQSPEQSYSFVSSVELLEAAVS